MWPYWLMFLLPLWAAVQPGRLRDEDRRIAWAACAAIYILFIGLRFEVGGDWLNYERLFYWAASKPIDEILVGGGDPAYYGMGWLIARMGGELVHLNLFCAIFLVCGAFSLAKRQPYAWVGVLACVPYLFIVVGMGYTRQSAAIGLAMFALAALADGKQVRFVLFVLAAAAFHKSAALLVPIAALASTRNRGWSIVWVSVMTGLAVWLFLAERSEQLWTSYVESDYADASSGGAIRVAMNAVPALIFLVFRKRLAFSAQDLRLWLCLSLLAMACIPFLEVSATAIDRLALYFIPLQAVVFARLPMLARDTRQRTAIVLGIVGYYAAVQFVWLNFAQHAFAWLPYDFLLPW